MPHHVIVDGSNLATEGRTLPSLKQLKEAIASYRADHPDALITVVVDATFGHRIDPKEVAEFEKAIETNEFVSPPAGAVGRGDGFVLGIAQKVNASILSNDSYQEFHGQYPWLFDEGRLIGGKPVPHVGWVFVNRVPVRGPVSRRSVKEKKVVEKTPGRRTRGRGAAATASISADGPMPVPKSLPPGAILSGGPVPAGVAPADKHADKGAQKAANDLLTFLSFVEHYPVGTAVTAVVDNYSSHGAYVSIGDVRGYVPLRLMADPAPRSAREVMELGETVTLVVASFAAARRSIDLAVPGMVPAALPAPEGKKPRKAAAKKAAEKAAGTGPSPEPSPPAPEAAGERPVPTSRRRAKAAAPRATSTVPAEPVVEPAVEPPTTATVEARPGRSSKRAAKAAPRVTTSEPGPTEPGPSEPAPPAPAPRKGASKKLVPVATEDAISEMIATAEQPAAAQKAVTSGGRRRGRAATVEPSAATRPPAPDQPTHSAPAQSQSGPPVAAASEPAKRSGARRRPARGRNTSPADAAAGSVGTQEGS